MPYDNLKYRTVWLSLSEKTRDAIRHKAQWEHMSLSAVMREWWPKLWKRVAVKDKV